MHNARRAERAARRAAELTGRRLPAAYPVELAEQLHAARYPATIALWQRHREASLELLAGAVELEQRAEAAKRAAVEAARFGVLEPSWAELGDVLGLSPAGAHKRYRDVEGPGPQVTIDEALE